MKYFTLLCFLLVGLVTPAQANRSDWNLVRQISPGTAISIKTNVLFRCEFSYATDDQIGCEIHHQEIVAHLTFERRRVREIRLSRPQAATILGAIIGAGAGVAIGSTVSIGKATKPTAALYFGGLGAAIGGGVGHFSGSGSGPAIYEQ